MAIKRYRVVREAHEHDNFFRNFQEYAGYRMYLVEAPYEGNNSYSYSKNYQYLVTREGFLPDQSLLIDQASEILPVREKSSIHLSGNKVVIYRPERHLGKDFEIMSFATDGEAIEKFGTREFNRAQYNIYNAKRTNENGYPDTLVRIFTRALYAKGMRIAANELVPLPARSSAENPHYEHDTSSKAYTDNLWRAVRNSSGAHSGPPYN